MRGRTCGGTPLPRSNESAWSVVQPPHSVSTTHDNTSFNGLEATGGVISALAGSPCQVLTGLQDRETLEAVIEEELKGQGNAAQPG